MTAIDKRNISTQLQENKEILNLKKHTYIVGDSLTEGLKMALGSNFVGNPKRGRTTTEMKNLIQNELFLENGESTINKPSVLFVLGGTNDIFNGVNVNTIKQNILEMEKRCTLHGIKFVPGTIPPMIGYEKKVNDLNNFIRQFPEYVDYNTFLKDPKNTNAINPKYASGFDKIHLNSAGYQVMRDTLEKTFEQLDFSSEYSLDRIIKKLENSIASFEHRIAQTLPPDTTQEQREKSIEIITRKKEILNLLKNIQTELPKVESELDTKSNELAVYMDKVDIDMQLDVSSQEHMELKEKMDTLEKRKLELEEQKAILLKEANLLLNQEKKINDKLEKQEINEMSEITVTEFLQKPFSERLKYVTIGNIDSDDVKNGNVSELEINFSFNGKFNRQLYMGTTASMILPPEVREVQVGGQLFMRNPSALQGEFFSENGKRLIIRDMTRIKIAKLLGEEEIATTYTSKIDISQYETELEKEIALESERRGIPEVVAKTLFLGELQKINDVKTRRAVMEDMFVDIDRKKGTYFSDFNKSSMKQDGNPSLHFLYYYAEGNIDVYRKIAEGYGYSAEKIQAAEKFGNNLSSFKYSGNIDVSRLEKMNISEEEVTRIRGIKRFQPNSQDAVILFRIAARVSNLPESWATNLQLHRILGRESAGIVGRLNYTIKGISISKYKELAMSNSDKKNPIGSKSTASGLGQLLLSNIDKYYPSGRQGIGDPIEEAIGFMKYIEDRYGNPNTAGSMYGKKGSYTHAKTGKPAYKGFREGY